MKYIKATLLFLSLTFLSSCAQKEDPFFFEGLSITEMQGEWSIYIRAEGNFPSVNHLELSSCDSMEVIIINSNGEAIHRVYDDSSFPCNYTDYSIKFIEYNSTQKKIEKIDLSNNREYLICNLYYSKKNGVDISVEYLENSDSLNSIRDSFRRK